MGYTLFAISAYIFMRAFEVVFCSQKNSIWYKMTIIVEKPGTGKYLHRCSREPELQDIGFP
jgi:hypothetical protein